MFHSIFLWIKSDFKSNPIRFGFELLAWSISIGCAVVMAATVPNPPFMVLYPTWITGCAIYAGCSYSRRSFGMLANYLLLVAIDCTALIRIML
jgi:hypothetical protein